MNGFDLTTKYAVLLLVVVWTFLNCGCRNLEVNDDQQRSGIVLPKPQMDRDSVALRVAVAEFDDHQKEAFESFVNITDQKLPLETRRRLDQNGFRVSVVSNVNSRQLQQLLAPQAVKREWLTKNERELADAGKLEPVFRVTSQRHVEKSRGESFHVEVSPVREQSVWAVYGAGELVSDRATLAQCEMRIASWPQPDGSVKLRFVPEVHHGQEFSRIGVEGQDMALRQSRHVEVLRSLTFEVELQPGETVIVAPTITLDRLGGLFFGTGDGSSETLVAATSSAEQVADDVDASEFFPMLAQSEMAPPSDSVEMLLASTDLFEGNDMLAESRSGAAQRPRPWQRALLIRVVEVTPEAIP